MAQQVWRQSLIAGPSVAEVGCGPRTGDGLTVRDPLGRGRAGLAGEQAVDPGGGSVSVMAGPPTSAVAEDWAPEDPDLGP